MNILTFDIEDWYCNCVWKDLNWDKYEVRIYEGVAQILELLRKRDLKATFFCLGWLADHHPQVIKDIYAEGHHIGCHSYQHELLTELSRKEFVQNTLRAKKAIENVIGEEVDAYRAPAWTVGAQNVWVLEELVKIGFKYDCSIFPSSHSFGGFINYGTDTPSIIKINDELSIKEFPVSIQSVFGQKIVFSGGGYFRFFPYCLINRWMKHHNYNMTYFHTQDFDTGQPVANDLPFTRRFKTYYGINGALDKFKRLIDEFDFVNIKKADDLINWDYKELNIIV